MRVLSLFDGMSCGRIALERAGVKVEKYYASEIDKYAMQISNKNYPDIIQVGDVTKWREWDIDLSKIDLLLAGFPCQAWSMAGKQKGDNDPRGALVHDLIDIWQDMKKHNPGVKFLFENVRMKKEFLDYINNLFGVKPICINSALVSAQNRVRYYWSNVDGVEQPEDRGIYLKDIIETGVIDREKSYCLDANYFKGGNKNQYFNKSRRQLVFEKPFRIATGGNGGQGQRVYAIEGESVTLSAMGGGWGAKTGLYYIEDNYRKLTPLECERLQTLPENYTDGVSNTQRYKMIGNGWTVSVIAHIFKGLNKV